MKYLLIIFVMSNINTSQPVNVKIQAIEFDSENTCKYAEKTFNDDFKYRVVESIKGHATCILK